MLNPLRLWANTLLRRDNRRLRARVQALRSRLKVRDAELDELAAVVARNRQRVDTETAALARQQRQALE